MGCSKHNREPEIRRLPLCGTRIGGSVVECSPATRAARVRFPADASFRISLVDYQQNTAGSKQTRSSFSWSHLREEWTPILMRKTKVMERKGFFQAQSALAGNRTPIDCLEGNHANHYTTNADILFTGKLTTGSVFSMHHATYRVRGTAGAPGWMVQGYFPLAPTVGVCTEFVS